MDKMGGYDISGLIFWEACTQFIYRSRSTTGGYTDDYIYYIQRDTINAKKPKKSIAQKKKKAASHHSNNIITYNVVIIDETTTIFLINRF